METLKIPNYIPRIADKTIAENMEAFGAVVIEGPKWCGKTSTAKNHAVSEISMADRWATFKTDVWPSWSRPLPLRVPGRV